MACGFVHPAAIIDWHNRKVPAWDASISMESDFCVRACAATAVADPHKLLHCSKYRLH